MKFLLLSSISLSQPPLSFPFASIMAAVTAGGGNLIKPPIKNTDDGDESEEELLSSGAEVAPFDVHTNLDRKTSVRLFCSGCHKNLPSSSSQEGVVECYGCHRRWHTTSDCHRKHSHNQPDPTVDELEGVKPYFHSPGCKRVCNSLLKLANQGQMDLPSKGSGSSSSLSWRMVFSRRPGHLGPLTWTDCLNVIRGDWRYSLADVRSFDVAAVLKASSPSPSPSLSLRGPATEPVDNSNMVAASAALLDVYGEDLAELIVLSTKKELRKKGYARDLVLKCISPALKGAGVKRLAVALDEVGDDSVDLDGGAKEMWAKMGFAPMSKTEIRRLSWSIPAFGRNSIKGVEYWSKDL